MYSCIQKPILRMHIKPQKQKGRHSYGRILFSNSKMHNSLIWRMSELEVSVLDFLVLPNKTWLWSWRHSFYPIQGYTSSTKMCQNIKSLWKLIVWVKISQVAISNNMPMYWRSAVIVEMKRLKDEREKKACLKVAAPEW